MAEMRCGIDVGGVIIGTDTDDKIRKPGDTMFGPDFLKAPAQPGMWESVSEIIDIFGPNNVFIISKCRRKMQAKTLAWLWYHAFYQKTGFKYTHVHFVETRPEKGPMGHALGLDIFIDDRQDVLEVMAEWGLDHPVLYDNWDQALKAARYFYENQ